MPESELRLIKRCAELRPKDQVDRVPRGLRGVYVLFEYHPYERKRKGRNPGRRKGRYKGWFDVVYVGMAGVGHRAGARGRLKQHLKKKGRLWSHFSVFEVWDNIREDELRELEGILRHIYRFDTRANRLNVQRAYKKLAIVRNNQLKMWQTTPSVRPTPSSTRG